LLTLNAFAEFWGSSDLYSELIPIIDKLFYMRRKLKHRLIIVALVILVFLGYTLFKKPNVPDLETLSLQEWFRCPSPVSVDKMPNKMKVVATSLQTMASKDSSLNQIIGLCKKIMHNEPDTRLIVFGEASLGIYFNSVNLNKYQRSIAESIPGKATDTLGKVARQLRVYLAVGLIEKAGDSLFNSMVVLDTAGNIIARHRKSFLHDYDVQNGIIEAQKNAQTFYIDSFQFGLSICADANTRWLMNTYREKKIDALIYSVTSDVPWIIRKTYYWPIAKKYNSWIIAANRFGNEGKDNYPGFIFVADKQGAIHKMKSKGIGYISVVIGKN